MRKLQTHVEEDLEKKAKAAAKADGRTLANWLRHLIEEAVAKGAKK